MTSQIKKLMTPTPNTDPFSLGEGQMFILLIFIGMVLYIYILLLSYHFLLLMTIDVRNKDSYYVVITGDVTKITIVDVKDVQNLVVIE
jgi:hypothetical protein